MSSAIGTMGRMRCSSWMTHDVVVDDGGGDDDDDYDDDNDDDDDDGDDDSYNVIAHDDI